MGAQVCALDGRSLGPCACSGADAGTDAATADAPAPRDAPPTDTGCAPGDVEPCFCPGAIGERTCAADGWGACRCPAVDAGAAPDAAPDAPSAPDAGCSMDLQTDPMNCGECGRRCALANATARCVAGECAIAACVRVEGQDFADCDGIAANGCEANRQSDVNSCGVCGRVCTFFVTNPSAPSIYCSLGRCGPSPCMGSTANCNGNASDGCEVSILSDPNHCGGCRVRCAAGRMCVNGRCES